ncbi:hypothetical protein AUP74_01880 [Microbulbifer aggregans]|uniref:Right handed beta helix domain-containing protein n=1 Tax=Microbulbifer aggregans TaxID=1769779 RepID=A0A1C9W826_9GAMM|nr:hypothetical protein AUP74_01880 [Microbulbifer aggregans]
MRRLMTVLLAIGACFSLAADNTLKTDADTMSMVPPELIVGPYRHVRPQDVGVSIGPGVIAAFPTATYRGSMKVRSPTTIENVVIEGCLRIESDNVILRNVVIRCDSFYPVKASDHSNARIEYSLVECSTPTKVFRLSNYRNFVVHRTETRGCEDLFFLGGNNDGLEVTYNYMHSLTLTPKSHADGFQFGKVPMSGSAIIRGNYFWANAEGPKTDIIFAEGASQVQFLIEDNFFHVWGLRTIRCGGEGVSCTIRNNVYEQAFENMNLLRYGKLLFSYLRGGGAHAASCNRLEDGSFAREYQSGTDRFYGVRHQVSDCPEWPY